MRPEEALLILSVGGAVVAVIAVLRYRSMWKAAQRELETLRKEGGALNVGHAVEAIAVEVERISEGQRFLTRVLGAKPPERVEQDVSRVPR